MPDTISSPYPIQVERWLRKEFYTMDNNKETVTLKDVKAFLPRINCKILTSKLREAFQEVDTTKQNEIGFDDFATLHNKLIFDENVSVICCMNNCRFCFRMTNFIVA